MIVKYKIPPLCAPGGGLYRSFPKERAVIKACRFVKNKANQYGGAIYEQNIADGAIQVTAYQCLCEHHLKFLLRRVTSLGLPMKTAWHRRTAQLQMEQWSQPCQRVGL